MAVDGTSTSLSSSIPRPTNDSVKRRFAFVTAFIFASARVCPWAPVRQTTPMSESSRLPLRPYAVTS